MPRFVVTKWNGVTHLSVVHLKEKRKRERFGIVILNEPVEESIAALLSLEQLASMFSEKIKLAEEKYADNQANK